jgi:subtilisin family serine protease
MNSNYGQCITFFAPGSGFECPGPRERFGNHYQLGVGPSASSAITAGAVAILLSRFLTHNWTLPTQLELRDLLIKMSTKNEVQDIGWFRRTPNRLLYLDIDFQI